MAWTWLRRVLDARTFPIDPHPSTILLTADQGLLFADQPLAQPSVDERRTLRLYLEAMAAQDPDRALDVLLPHLNDGHPLDWALDDLLRRRTRQLMPFRNHSDNPVELGSSFTERRDHLADFVLLHAELLQELELQPSPTVESFFRSLGPIHGALRRLVSDRDILCEVFEALQVRHGLHELRQWFHPERLGEDMQQVLQLWMEMPQKLDSLLSLALADPSPPRVPPRSRSHRHPERPRWRRFQAQALFLAFVALAALVHRLTVEQALAPSDQRLAAATLGLLGLCLLFQLGQGHG